MIAPLIKIMKKKIAETISIIEKGRLHVRFSSLKSMMFLYTLLKEPDFWDANRGNLVYNGDKISKYQKQNTKFSHIPKKQQNFVHFFALAAKTCLKQKITELVIRGYLIQ